MPWIWMEKGRKSPKKLPKQKLALTWICSQDFALPVRPENLSAANFVVSSPSWL